MTKMKNKKSLNKKNNIEEEMGEKLLGLSINTKTSKPIRWVGFVLFLLLGYLIRSVALILIISVLLFVIYLIDYKLEFKKN